MTDAQFDQLVENLRRWEGDAPWMYRDSAPEGNVTVGIGMLLASPADAVALPFMVIGQNRGATGDEIAQAFAAVMAMPPALPASRYQLQPPIELAPEEVRALAERRLTDHYLPGIEHLLPNFEALPWPAQQVTVDMAWNLGIGGLAKFTNYLAALERGAWQRAAVESHVSTSRPERNDWRRGLMLLAASG